MISFKNRSIYFVILILFFFVSCLSTKSLNGIVKNTIEQDASPVKLIKTDYLVLNTEKLPMADSLVSSTKIKSYFIPALLYWGKNNTLGCTIGNCYFSNLFAEKLKEMVLQVDLENLLNGRKLEISIESIPNRFVYTNKFDFVFLVSVYSYSYQESIYPDDLKFTVSYRITQGKEHLKSGVFTLPDTMVPMGNEWGSPSKFIGNYIEELKFNFEQQSIDVLNKIFDEVE